ncbi:ATP-dependent DNA ligase [Pseudomonas sp. M47T1]|uniref:non-homologous end-joining DNA ligase n=1 Tax=unclassified Pseudomonas TaxID=196821 RepID=UPI00026085D1|nr:non-homologous end-joining DNA ligase [Pseudomonas sp. M47T1]EIK96028.1 ATP-dependent DNA ligase [Pseudomonas sp. M47T1]
MAKSLSEDRRSAAADTPSEPLPLPSSLAPQRATRVEQPPEGDWLYEIKHDGYRLMSRISGGEVRLFNREGLDWTADLPRQAAAIAALNLSDCWLDGKLVQANADGVADYLALQEAFESGRCLDLQYYLFDLPFHNGQDLREQPLEARRTRLKKLLSGSRHPLLRYSESFTANTLDVLEGVCTLNHEGVIGKRRGSHYHDGERNLDWIKLDCLSEDSPTPPMTESQARHTDDPHHDFGDGHRESVAGVSLSTPERIVDRASQFSKVELARFYQRLAGWLLPQLKERPVALMRAPQGVEGDLFLQRHTEHLTLPHINLLPTALDPGHAPLMQIDHLPALIEAVQRGAVEFHAWGASRDRLDLPDRLVLDLDPDPALPWRTVQDATLQTLALLDGLGLRGYVKTSGGKGMHLIVPLARHARWNRVLAFAKAIAHYLMTQMPERFTAAQGPRSRAGRIFVDYLRNQRGASTVAAYSVRARPGLPISTPISRDELESVSSAQHWHVGNILQRLEQQTTDPWHGYNYRQRLTERMWTQLGVEPPHD